MAFVSSALLYSSDSTTDLALEASREASWEKSPMLGLLKFNTVVGD